jgi:hypothetical protein
VERYAPFRFEWQMQDDPLLRRAELAILESKMIRRQVRANLTLARVELAQFKRTTRWARLELTQYPQLGSEMVGRACADPESPAEKKA